MQARFAPTTKPESLTRDVAGSFEGMPLRGNMFSITDLLRAAEDTPPSMGAYVLLIELAAPLAVTLPGKPSNHP